MIAALDGCQAGWIASVASRWPVIKGDLKTEVYRNFKDAIDDLKKCSIVVFDMPTGLSDPARNIPWPRVCDQEAKGLLGKAHPRVFFAPPRSVINAESYDAFNKAHGAATGKGVSIQAWGIVPKIREVDDLLTTDLQRRVKEFHPELVFFNLSGNIALPKKQTPDGQAARRKVIATGIGEDDLKSAELLVKKTARVAIDDLYDSLIGLELCQRIVDNNANVIPANPPIDSKGLRMEIWY